MLGSNDDQYFFGKNFPNIGSYIQRAMGEALEKMEIHHGNDVHFASEVFETHNNVIAKIRIPKNVQVDQLKVLVNDYEIKLKSTKQNRTQVIKLPSPVNHKSAKALYHNGVLQVQMKKCNKSKAYHEVYIRFQ